MSAMHRYPLPTAARRTLGALALAWVAPADGRAKAQTCSVCHGPSGIAVASDTPNLTGQPETYLVRQLRAFRAGERRHEVMNVIAKPLTDDDIANLAAWFSSFAVEAKPAR